METGQHVPRRQVMELLARLQEQTAVEIFGATAFPERVQTRQSPGATLAVYTSKSSGPCGTQPTRSQVYLMGLPFQGRLVLR